MTNRPRNVAVPVSATNCITKLRRCFLFEKNPCQPEDCSELEKLELPRRHSVTTGYETVSTITERGEDR
ncbi:unnamed protein product [Heterotrigona itama]|uniref:Uncharacterized protein n=1 Tax=Heterotrigona itama TaxID=395501 RepID=A0A6V7HJW1_9HYME|nr:unnamed protein product [Heterotrigona itama]